MAMKRKNLPELAPQVFEHEQFGKIRFIQQNGELWFVAADVCCALDLENVTKALYPLADDEKNTFTISKGIVYMTMKRKNLPEVVPELFEHEEFGQFRFVKRDEEIWFVAVDVCRALDIKNVRQNLANFPDDEKRSVILSTNGVTNTVSNTYGTNDATSGGWIENRVTVVSEPGLYRLIFMSRKPEAEKFKRWVFHEVLPSIRKTGSYSVAAEKKMVIYFKKPAPELLEPMTEEEFFDVIGKLAEAERIEIRQG